MKFIPSDNAQYEPASHERPDQPGVLKRVIATAAEFPSGQTMMLNHARLPAASAFRSHYHEDMQETFVILSGSVVMTVDNSEVPLRAGDAIIIDPREVHTMRNTGDDTAEYIVFGISTGQGGRTIVTDP